MMTRYAILRFRALAAMAASAALVVTGCTTPTEANRFSLDVAQRVCNVDALAEEKATQLATVNTSKRSIRQFQNRFGSYNEQTMTILASKLNAYEAEVEAAYRFVTQACGAYMRCLERNDYNETDCLRTEARWNQSQKRFSDLSLEIRRIAAETEIELARIEKGCCTDGDAPCCSDNSGGSGGGGGTTIIIDNDNTQNNSGPAPTFPPLTPVPCCDVIGDVFTDCCDTDE